MKKLQPFGDVPKKLTEQLRRSFVASRTFAQALLEGKQIVNKISKVTKASFYMVLYLRIFQLSFLLGCCKVISICSSWANPPTCALTGCKALFLIPRYVFCYVNLQPFANAAIMLRATSANFFFCSQLMNVSLNFYQFSTRFPWLKKAAIFIMGGYPMRLWWWDRDAVLSWRIFW